MVLLLHTSDGGFMEVTLPGLFADAHFVAFSFEKTEKQCPLELNSFNS
jgi:hypothetical protein